MYFAIGGGGQTFKPSKDVVQLQYENVYPKGQVGPDNQTPDEWSSTVVGAAATAEVLITVITLLIVSTDSLRWLPCKLSVYSFILLPHIAPVAKARQLWQHLVCMRAP